MSYREKIQWVSLATMVVVWGVYFARLADSLAGGRPEPGEVLGGFAGAAILLVLLQVGGTIAVALYRPSEAERRADPRETEIERHAGNLSYSILMLLTVGVMLATPLFTVILPAALGHPTGGVAAMLVGNAMLAALVIAALCNAACQIVLYRRHG